MARGDDTPKDSDFEAVAAEVAKGTVYLYYSNKVELLLHVIARQKRQYLEGMAPAFDLSIAPAKRLRTLIRLGIQLGHELPLMNRAGAEDHEIEAVLQEADAATLDAINGMQIEYTVRLLAAVTGHRQPRAALEARAQVLVDPLFAVVNGGRQVHQGMPLDAYAAAVAEIIVGGIAGGITGETEGELPAAILPVPDMAQGVEWAFETPIRGGLGLTYFNPAEGGLSSDSRFSFSGAAGVRIHFGDRVGIRIEGRL